MSLGSLHLTVAAIMVLAVLVIWGTFYQVDNGIYAAQERFFTAWITMIAGIIPFPAVKTVVSVLSLNLLVAAFRKRPLNINTFGLIVIHIGVAVLIAGTAIASNYNKESAVILAQGQSASETNNFASWQFVASVTGRENGAASSKVYRFDLKKLRQGQRIKLPPTSIKVTLQNIYKNCAVKLDTADRQAITALHPIKLSTDEGRNTPGIIYSVAAPGNGNKGEQLNKVNFLYSGVVDPTPFYYGHDTIMLSLEPEPMPLPFKVTLLKFSAAWHPGTDKAKSFESRLRVLGKNVDREVVVEMNRPFRYKSYTFYQMGYSEQDGGYTTTLAVVKNPLRYMPYIASLIIVAGLFLHFIVKMWRNVYYTGQKGRQ